LIILNAYNSFIYDDDKVAIWVEILKDVPFELAQANLRKYIRDPENKFPPHPGALAVTQTQYSSGPYIPNAEETLRMLEEREVQFRLKGAAPPENLREVVRSLVRTESSDA
jgi:hypothetical protein